MPEELTDETGEIIWECSYRLWDKPVQEIAHTEIQQNLRYQGQYLDRETGLHYNTFRYYDPDIGRFTQPDPIGLAGGLNLYQYAPNAFMWIDPWGWACKPNHQAGKSPKKYGHARNRHGSQLKKQQVMDRAKTKGEPRGHFSDNRLIEEAFDKAPKTPGVHDVKVSQPSNVYYPDGTTKTTDIVRVVIRDKPITAYPYVPGD